jgi:hypothetical protein
MTRIASANPRKCESKTVSSYSGFPPIRLSTSRAQPLIFGLCHWGGSRFRCLLPFSWGGLSGNFWFVSCLSCELILTGNHRPNDSASTLQAKCAAYHGRFLRLAEL